MISTIWSAASKSEYHVESFTFINKWTATIELGGEGIFMRMNG